MKKRGEVEGDGQKKYPLKKVDFVEYNPSTLRSDTGLLDKPSYNQEQILQFRSVSPSFSQREFQEIQPKDSHLMDDDIELDENGNNLQDQKHLQEQFSKFDSFLLQNRQKIEKQSDFSSNSIRQGTTISIKEEQLENTNQATQPALHAFDILKKVKIDFSKIAQDAQKENLEEKRQASIKNYIGESQNTMLNNASNNSHHLNYNHATPHLLISNQKQNFFSRKKDKAITLAHNDNALNTFGLKKYIKEYENRQKALTNVQDIILQLSIRTSIMIYKFIRKLKGAINYKGIQNLNNSQQLLINDLAHQSSVEDSIQKRSTRFNSLGEKLKEWMQKQISLFTTPIANFLKNFLSSKPIDPTTNWMVMWQCLQFIFIVAALFYTPLEIIYGDTYDRLYGKGWILFKIINSIAFTVDILFKFNMGFFEKGQIVTDRTEIVKEYFRANFWFDFFALIPVIQTLLQINFLRGINLLILLKVVTASGILQHLKEMISQKNSKLQNALSLTQLLLMICSICHVFACLFMGIAVIEEQYEITSSNWMKQNKIEGDHIHWFSKYICSLYFSVTTMITVGYGDVVPITPYEMFFVTIAMFVSCGVFAYSFNQIGDLVREQNKSASEFKSEMILVNRLLEKKKINRELKIQVKKFLEFRFYAEPQLSMEEEQTVMNKLSHHLREKELRVSKNEIIYEQGDEEDDPYLYIIDKGAIEIFLETDKGENQITLIATLEQAMYFGELNFFRNGPRETSARANDFTILYGISRSQFLQIVSNFPIDYEKYCFIRDSVCLSTTISKLDSKCYGCQKNDHSIGNCPKIHYAPEKEGIYLKSNFSFKQQRNNSNLGRKKYKFCSLLCFTDINNVQAYFMEQDENYIYIITNYPDFNQDYQNSIIEEEITPLKTQNNGMRKSLLAGVENKKGGILNREENMKRAMVSSINTVQEQSLLLSNNRGMDSSKFESEMGSPCVEKHYGLNLGNIQMSQAPNLFQRQITQYDKVQSNNLPKQVNNSFNINGSMNLGSSPLGLPKLPLISTQRGSIKTKPTILLNRFSNKIHTTRYFQQQQQQFQSFQEEDEQKQGVKFPKEYSISNMQQQMNQTHNLLSQLLKALSSVQGSASPSNHNNNSHNNGSNIRNLRELSQRRNTTHFSIKKKDILAQVQMDHHHNADIIDYFDKSKNYTIYFPKYNQNLIIKSLETFQYAQPSYFGMYSFKIRSLSSKQKKIFSQQNNRRMKFLHKNSNNDSQNLSSSRPMSSAYYRKTESPNSQQHFNNQQQNFNSNSSKFRKNTDFKKSKSNALLTIQKSPCKADSSIFSFNGFDKNSIKSENQFESCILEEQEEHNQESIYPKFIFKKLLTLS